MDPQIIALLQEAQQTIAMQAEEIQALRQQVKKPAEGMQKKASINKIAAIVGMREDEVPEFLKFADENDLFSFISTIETRAKHTAIGKVAEISDGSQSEDPGERLESALANLVSN